MTSNPGLALVGSVCTCRQCKGSSGHPCPSCNACVLGDNARLWGMSGLPAPLHPTLLLNLQLLTSAFSGLVGEIPGSPIPSAGRGRRTNGSKGRFVNSRRLCKALEEDLPEALQGWLGSCPASRLLSGCARLQPACYCRQSQDSSFTFPRGESIFLLSLNFPSSADKKGC